MNEINLLEQLKGPWNNALIMTYSLDIIYLEKVLLRLFSRYCRNKIILANGLHYLEEFNNCARYKLVHHLNQRYIVDGIFAPHPAHAKIILLTNQERGRLLVGSGNLGQQGYASGGELFTKYEYTEDEHLSLSAFHAVLELINSILDKDYVGKQVTRYIRCMLDKTPWLFKSAINEWSPVRHNLNYSFLNQLKHFINNEVVEELWVLSPFYDKRAVALEHLIETFNPKRTYLLVQSGYTSADPIALKRLLSRFRKQCQLCSISKKNNNTYIHAKLYLFKLPNKAICLQGSPNLSKAAMLLTYPQGNIELANLLSGPRNAYDELLGILDIKTKGVVLNSLDLNYQPRLTSIEQEYKDLRLIRGEWYDNQLNLYFYGEMLNIKNASLIINNNTFLLDVMKQEPQSLRLRLSPNAVALLGKPLPIAIRFGQGDNALTTNYIFICNRVSLNAVLELTNEVKTLDKIGDLDLNDDEFIRLLMELEAALVIDLHSVCKPIKDKDSIKLKYGEVDYEMLRKHPKIQQYIRMKTSDQRYTRSRLQIILNAITNHLRELFLKKPITHNIERLMESKSETEKEHEQKVEENQRRRLTEKQRIKGVLKRFINRYVRSISNPDFYKIAGFEVMTHNYVIFTYILWRLFSKDWVESYFIIESLLKMWSFFWGNDSDEGYFRELNKEKEYKLTQLINGEQHTHAILLASLYYSAYLTRIKCWEGKQLQLRDIWREILHHPYFKITSKILKETYHIISNLIPHKTPIPTEIVKELTHLAQFETKSNFLYTLKKQYNHLRGNFEFESKKVWRKPLNHEDTVNCLMLYVDNDMIDKETIISILKDWMKFEDLSYYRIHVSTGIRLYYEVFEQKGLCWIKNHENDQIELSSIYPITNDWEHVLLKIQSLAKKLDIG